MIELRSQRRSTLNEISDVDEYNRIYSSEPIGQIDSFYDWALCLLDPRAGEKLLDVSCGAGSLVRIASIKGLKSVGIDYAEFAVELAAKSRQQGQFIVGDAESLPFESNAFDIVCNLGSLEHYHNPAAGVREMARVLRINGRAVVLVPNTFSLLHVLYAWRNGKVFNDGQPLQRYGTYADWSGLLEQNGLRIVRTVKYQRVMPRRGKDVLWYFHHPMKFVQAALTPFLPLHAAFCYTFICARA